jgi:hypothetical protein
MSRGGPTPVSVEPLASVNIMPEHSKSRWRQTTVPFAVLAIGLTLVATCPWGPCGPASITGVVGELLLLISSVLLIRRFLLVSPEVQALERLDAPD